MIDLITGVAGFIGSNLALRLLDRGHHVVGIDRKGIDGRYLSSDLIHHPNFKYYQYELTHFNLAKIKEDVDWVWHMAANADIRFSAIYHEKDLHSLLATYDLLNWMEDREIKDLCYASSAAVYGEPTIVPIPETYAPTQTSFYGASKLACEAFIQAHCEAFDANAWIFRYVSILGRGYSHGFVYNFYRALKENPHTLYVHGGPGQKRSYLYVQDCIDAMFTALTTKPSLYNVGHDDVIGLMESIPIITEYMGVNPNVIWSGKKVGWVGDSKTNQVDISKLKALGWTPKMSIKDSIIKTLDWLETNQWVLKERGEA